MAAMAAVPSTLPPPRSTAPAAATGGGDGGVGYPTAMAGRRRATVVPGPATMAKGPRTTSPAPRDRCARCDVVRIAIHGAAGCEVGFYAEPLHAVF